MGAASLSPPFIYNLPNEVLQDIFALIPMNNSVQWARNGKKRELVQFMVLLQVCRTFRMAAFESRALLHWKFDLSTLIPWDFIQQDAPQVRILRMARLLDVLFADKRFAQSVARKTDWTLSEHLEILFALMARIHTFERTTRKVFVNLDGLTQSALTRLSVCRLISELGIDSEGAPLDLNVISQGFPRLQHLKIALGEDVDGSLERLEHLISFDVNAVDGSDLFTRLGRQVFPWASANTLVRIKLANCIVHLQSLPKLQQLHIESWEAGYGDIIDSLEKLDAPLLETFKCTVPHLARLTSLGPMFANPSLSRVQSLTLRAIGPQLHHPREYDPFVGSSALVNEVAAKCRNLHHVVFNISIDLANLTCLSRLLKLRSITWVVDLDTPLSIRGKGSPEEALRKVFKSSQSVPKIEVVRSDKWDWREPERWPYHF
jgi:hypothetical protein